MSTNATTVKAPKKMSQDMLNLFSINKLAKRKLKLNVILEETQTEINEIDTNIKILLRENGLIGENLSVQKTQTSLVTFSRQSSGPCIRDKMIEVLREHPEGLTCSQLAQKVEAHYITVYNNLRATRSFVCDDKKSGSAFLWTLAE
jgi:hypothetical protein